MISTVEAKFKDFQEISRIQMNDGFKHAYFLDKNRFKCLLERGEKFYIFIDDNRGGLE